VNYEVWCPCGQVARGQRRKKHQVVPCDGCGRGLFVFPASVEGNAAPDGPRLSRRRLWLALGAAAVVGVAAIVYGSLPAPRAVPTEDARAEVAALVAKARAALAKRSFLLARDTLNEAIARRDRRPGDLPPDEHRELNQLHREADALARLLSGPLEDVVRLAKASGRDPDEWKARFDRDFAGRSVILEDDFFADDADRPEAAGLVFEEGGEAFRVALEDVAALRQLPLPPRGEGKGRRLVFAFRLRRCALERDEWVIRPEGDSGTLFTEADALEALYTRPAPELRAALAWQRERLAELPAPPPARP
jgi:hypothetical protein